MNGPSGKVQQVSRLKEKKKRGKELVRRISSRSASKAVSFSSAFWKPLCGVIRAVVCMLVSVVSTSLALLCL